MLGFRNSPASVRLPSLCTYPPLRQTPSPLHHHAVCQTQGPTQHRLYILEPRPGLRPREQPPRGALWYDGMKAVRARRTSIYLRLLPQRRRRRRHRTLGVAGLGEAERPGSGGPQAVSPRFRPVPLQQRQYPLSDLPVPVPRVLPALSYRTEPAELKCPP